MARYELGAIYKIDGKNKGTYYARLLTKDCYGVFAPLKGELNEHSLKLLIISILFAILFL